MVGCVLDLVVDTGLRVDSLYGVEGRFGTWIVEDGKMVLVGLSFLKECRFEKVLVVEDVGGGVDDVAKDGTVSGRIL